MKDKIKPILAKILFPLEFVISLIAVFLTYRILVTKVYQNYNKIA